MTVQAHVDNAAERIGRVWPLYSDVGANPLSGFEDEPFREAVADAQELFGGRGYPSAEQFKTAWDEGQIDPEILRDVLSEHGITDSPEALLSEMAEVEHREDDRYDETLNKLLSKWLAAFLDQGQAAWGMPNREAGFYQSWRRIARYDQRIPEAETPVATYYRENLADLPDTALEALYAVLNGHPEERWEPIFTHHLAALPGWIGLIKQRMADNNNPWQEQYPITVTEYLAVRLSLAKHMGVPVDPEERETASVDSDDLQLHELWLTAWERTYRQRLLADVKQGLDQSESSESTGRPDAQLVFCIDTRSEIIRRHVEATGDYETHGYAGFFGVPIEYSEYGSKTQTDSCPVMVDPKHHVTERKQSEKAETAATHERWNLVTSKGTKVLKSLKNDLVAAFGLVEASGAFFGAMLTSRTLRPSLLRDARDRAGSPHSAEFTELTLEGSDDPGDGDLPVGISTEQKAFYAEAAFDLMGWEEFAPLVVFTGHRSQNVNNPYRSSVDCGACAGSPGTPNARTLAAICNDPEVQSILRDHGFDIPSDTVFVAAEHNTTTDEVTLFADDLPEKHREIAAELQEDLARAQEAAAEERLETMDIDADDSVRAVQKRTDDWAQPRPELGLSGNASFVIGPRRLTANADLDGRAFLHSYDWSTDADGEALENIMAGPLVVCQMINAQYYFSTVDNTVYGSGSKTTHNAVGNVGVLQGNGGDLAMGLPLQSLYADDREPYHQPIRLSTVIYAPVSTVAAILERNPQLRTLLDNGWMSLTVIDPEQHNEVFEYRENLEWEPERESAAVEKSVAAVH